MDILFEDKVKIGSSMSKAIDFLYDPKTKNFYSRHAHGGAENIEMDNRSIIGLLNMLKQNRDRMRWTEKGKKLFPKLAPTKGDTGRNRIKKGEL